jgi:tRNA(Ile)-lysidine synthase
MDLLRSAAATIAKHRMMDAGDGVLVALSGGPDSVALLRALAALGYRCHALYIDHGLRPRETPAEAAFCRALAEGLGVPFRSVAVEVAARTGSRGGGIQETARDLRYASLADEAARLGIDRIALGHTLDDQAETLLMRLIRGTGPRGLGGIPPVRGPIVRPLIETPRTSILAFLAAEGQEYMTDSSNLSEKYTRNRLRARLMPVLREFNPSIVETLGRASAIFREEERYFEVQVAKALMRMMTGGNRPGRVELFRVPLGNLDRVIRRRVLRRAMEEKHGLRGLEFGHIEDILTLCEKGCPGDRVSLPHGMRAVMGYATLLITSEPPVRLGEHVLAGEGTVVMPEIGEAIVATVTEERPSPRDGRRLCVLDADSALFPLVIRPRKAGDAIRPEGFGHRRKLQDLFVDLKISREERDAVPVVESGGGIVWVAGVRADGRFSATDATRRFLVLELKPAPRNPS